MRWSGWDHVMLDTDKGNIRYSGEASPVVDAIAPVIISASRSTDIPALYGDWFMERLKKGYITWTSPFNGRIYPVSFTKARVFVFWSKNPRPFFPALKDLIRNGRQFIVLYTLNDYQKEGLEPGIPSLENRIQTFHEISSVIGKGRLTWRFDPLLLSDALTVKDLLHRIGNIGDRIAADAGRLVISFIDIEKYDRVKRNLASAGIPGLREFSDEETRQLALGLSKLNENWNLEIQACGEGVDLSQYGIGRGECISFDLLAREFPQDPVLMEFLSPSTGFVSLEKRKREMKDPGQRGRCGCIVSKDIGRYSTCIHGCKYCYATSSQKRAEMNYRTYCDCKEQGIFLPGIIG